MNPVEKLDVPAGLRLRIFLQPKASRDQIVGLHDNELKITITAPPVEGAANAHLLKFLSKLFNPNPKQIPAEIHELLAKNDV